MRLLLVFCEEAWLAALLPQLAGSAIQPVIAANEQEARALAPTCEAALLCELRDPRGSARLARAIRRADPDLRLMLIGRVRGPLLDEVLPERVFAGPPSAAQLRAQLEEQGEAVSLDDCRLAWFPRRVGPPLGFGEETVIEARGRLLEQVADGQLHGVVLLIDSCPACEELVGDLRALAPTLAMVALGGDPAVLLGAGASSVLPLAVARSVLHAQLRTLLTMGLATTHDEVDYPGVVVDALGQGLAVVQGDPPVLVWWNPALPKRLGYSSEELEGRPLRQIETPAGESISALVAQVRMGIHPPPAEVGLRTRIGALHRVVLIARGLPGQELSGDVLLSFHSLEVVEAGGPVAQRKETLALLGETAAGIAHEVRNSLASIGGPLEVISGQFPPEHMVRRVLDKVRGRLRQTNEMLGELLGYARPLLLRPGLVDARTILQSAVTSAQEQLGTSRPFELRLPERPLVLEVDASLVGQAVHNLLLNARQVCPEGRIQAAVSREGGFALFDVADDGPGVPEELRDRIFQPFVTTRSQGTGLGLPLVRKVVERHGGTISLQPSDRGAHFRIALPVQQPRAARPLPAPRA